MRSPQNNNEKEDANAMVLAASASPSSRGPTARQPATQLPSPAVISHFQRAQE